MARTFPGVNDNILASVSSIDCSVACSISCWVFFRGFPQHNNFWGLCGKTANGWPTTGSALVMYLQVSGGTNWVLNVQTELWTVNVGNWQAAVGLPLANQWVHLCATYSSSSVSNVPVLYINGVSTSLSVTSTPSGTLLPDLGLMYMGNTDVGNNNLNGNLCEVGLWNMVLTQADVTSLASGSSLGTIEPAALKGYWPLCGVASPEPDLLGGNNGVVTGTAFVAHPPNVLSPCILTPFASEEASLVSFPSSDFGRIFVG